MPALPLSASRAIWPALGLPDRSTPAASAARNMRAAARICDAPGPRATAAACSIAVMSIFPNHLLSILLVHFKRFWCFCTLLVCVFFGHLRAGRRVVEELPALVYSMCKDGGLGLVVVKRTRFAEQASGAPHRRVPSGMPSRRSRPKGCADGRRRDMPRRAARRAPPARRAPRWHNGHARGATPGRNAGRGGAPVGARGGERSDATGVGAGHTNTARSATNPAQPGTPRRADA